MTRACAPVTPVTRTGAGLAWGERAADGVVVRGADPLR
jgi:hypothetical protein